MWYMKKSSSVYLALLLIAAVTLAACNSATGSARVTPFPTNTASAADSVAESRGTATLTPEAEDLPTDGPTVTDTPTAEPAPGTDTPKPTATTRSTATPRPTATSTATVTPTSLPQVDPTAALNITGSMAEGVPTPPTAIPSPVPVFDMPAETTNILLLGVDSNADGSDGDRTDTMIIVSINHETRTASMISLPRDLYVYMPNRIMGRLNTAYVLGGAELLEQTILYNFGIPIHYYARVNFEGFKKIVDVLGGVTMAVSCPLEDWRLISPELDPTLEENWERYKLGAGIHDMDGDMALWYARSRLSTNDFDRGRRQQQLLHAMFNQGVDLGLVTKVPELWAAFSEYVQTDMDIGRILQLAAMAPDVRRNGIQHLYLAGKMKAWSVPESGASVQLPIWEGDNMFRDTFRRLVLPPALNRADRAPITVEVINASGLPAQGRLAADNLAWYGFVPVLGETRPMQSDTEMVYFGDNFKGSYDWLFSWVMGKRASQIELVSEPSEFNYRVVIGTDYNPCRPAFDAPQADLPGES